jgi:hypothetical protein
MNFAAADLKPPTIEQEIIRADSENMRRCGILSSGRIRQAKQTRHRGGQYKSYRFHFHSW